MTIGLAIALASIGASFGFGFAVVALIAVRKSSRLTIDLAAARAETAVAGGELRASRERNLQIGATLARQAKNIRELEGTIQEMAIYLPKEKTDLILRLLDAATADGVLPPASPHGDDPAEVLGEAYGVADVPDPKGPLPG